MFSNDLHSRNARNEPGEGAVFFTGSAAPCFLNIMWRGADMKWFARNMTPEEAECEYSERDRSPEFPPGWWVGPLLALALIAVAAVITAIIF